MIKYFIKEANDKRPFTSFFLKKVIRCIVADVKPFLVIFPSSFYRGLASCRNKKKRDPKMIAQKTSRIKDKRANRN